MKKRFNNIQFKINNLLLTKKYFVSIPPAKKKISFEEEYHNETFDPDGKKENFLMSERTFCQITSTS